MQGSRLERLAPLSGAAAAVLALAGSVTGATDYLPSAQRAIELFSESPMGTILFGYLGLLAAFNLAWFAGSLYRELRAHEDGPGRLSIVAMAGAVGSALMLASAYTAKIVGGARAGAEAGIDPVAAVTLYDLSAALLGNTASVTFALFIGATALLTLRTGVFATWFGWVSVALAVGLISPFGYLFIAFGLLWLIGVSLALYRRELSRAANPEQ